MFQIQVGKLFGRSGVPKNDAVSVFSAVTYLLRLASQQHVHHDDDLKAFDMDR